MRDDFEYDYDHEGLAALFQTAYKALTDQRIFHSRQIEELSIEILRLTKENAKLRSHNDELHGHLTRLEMMGK